MGNMLCCACVPQANVGFVTRFGKFDRIATPGLTCVVPCCGEAVESTETMQVRQLDVPVETKTKDNVFVIVHVAVQYCITEGRAFDAHYALQDHTRQLSSYIFDVVRAWVPKVPLDDVFETKEEIAERAKTELAGAMSEYGWTICHVLITDIDPDSRVKQAMNEINTATRLRVAAMEQAEAAKIKVVKAAEADAESKYLAGLGIARQRRAIAEGLRDTINTVKEAGAGETADATGAAAVNTKDVMDLVLITVSPLLQYGGTVIHLIHTWPCCK
eukprot:TRINITY_DN1890_c0_g1_i1.p1 TRINITY_DN1890_c0_g1~~TRINITY_DN1890_c0_g1_i1.p1  ORF type:complete len:273 (+),score=70.56 TRINITY_DN1890_c0_g1_i1:90-908(+)